MGIGLLYPVSLPQIAETNLFHKDKVVFNFGLKSGDIIYFKFITRWRSGRYRCADDA